MLKCDYCGKEDADVEETTDPYMEEILDEEVLGLWCKECYLDRQEDV